MTYQHGTDPSVSSLTWQQRLGELLEQLQRQSETYLGYPNNQLLDHRNLAPFLDLVVNNIGDPEIGNLGLHTCVLEREVVAFFRDVYRLPADLGWGYVTNGGTESNIHGFFTGRERYPGAPLLFSADSHYSIDKAGRLLGMPREIIASQPHGEIDYAAFEATLRRLQAPAVVINANIGTTMKGAIDDVGRMVEILHRCNVSQYHLHCDAALFGGYLPFLDGAPRVDFTLPIHSLAISGHKFPGSAIPCGILLTRRDNLDPVRRRIDYIGSFDGTIAGSRNGLSVLILWQTIQRHGRAGFAAWAAQCIDNTKYCLEKLHTIGWEAWANPWSNTIVIRRPAAELARRWHLAVAGEIAHLVIMPSTTRAGVDRCQRAILPTSSPHWRITPTLPRPPSGPGSKGWWRLSPCSSLWASAPGSPMPARERLFWQRSAKGWSGWHRRWPCRSTAIFIGPSPCRHSAAVPSSR